MGRLRAETLERMESYADRVLAVADHLERKRRPRRIIDQVSGSGTSAAANVFEADEALTAKDFAKTLGITAKELNETRFWLRLFIRRGWFKPKQLSPLLEETLELKSMFGAMIVRTRDRSLRKPRRAPP